MVIEIRSVGAFGKGALTGKGFRELSGVMEVPQTLTAGDCTSVYTGKNSSLKVCILMSLISQ